MTDLCTSGCSSLARLSLSADEIAALGRQGFVTHEFRGGRGPYFKLRFRVNGRQRVRYLGADSDAAAEIVAEVAELQKNRRAELELSQLTRQARQLARTIKQQLEPIAKQYGLSFHGRQIRDRTKTE